MATAKNTFISNKIKKIAKEGVRKNTHMPVSAMNPRRDVPNKQRVAIAESMYRQHNSM